MTLRSLGVLCARGASKRLPRKHLRPLQGVPLVGWMCRAAGHSALTSIVLTTEDAEIAATAERNGIHAIARPPQLAEDFAADFDIVVDALDRMEAQEGAPFDVVVMLQPTTPFIRPEDIDGCLAKLADDPGLATCFTARPVSEPPQWMFIETPEGRAAPLLDGVGSNDVAHKQLLPPCWYPSGAAYAVRTPAFRAQRKIYCTPYAVQPMERERATDIDEAVDLIVAESIATARGFAPYPLTMKRLFAHTGDDA